MRTLWPIMGVAGMMTLLAPLLLWGADPSLQQWVERLGHPSFRVREQAAAQLVRQGRAARSALVAGLSHPDREIAERCRMLLPLAIRYDLEQRLADLEADHNQQRQHDLPGWSRYSRLVGADSASKQLFAAMLRAQAELLEAIDLEPTAASEAYVRRTQELFRARFSGMPQSVDVPNVATALWLGTFEPAAKVGTRSHSLVVVMTTEPFRTAIETGEWAKPLQKLYVLWLENRHTAEVLSSSFNLGANLGIRELLPLAFRIALDKDRPPMDRFAAIGTIGRLAKLHEVQPLEKLLDEATPIAANKFGTRTQIRDIALAALVQASGQALTDFHFDAEARFPSRLYPTYFGFPSDQKREEAIAKWRGQQRPK